MTDKKQDLDLEIDVLKRVYPDAESLFSFAPESLEAVKDNCLVVLDTNALLVPFSTGRHSLDEIRRVFATLARDKRLIIPGQVAREFAKNRPEKLTTLFHSVSERQNLTVKPLEFPQLELIEEYKAVKELEAQLSSQVKAYRIALKKLLDVIGGWHWNDPVSSMYRELFTASAIHDPSFNQGDVQADLQIRIIHKIPPGYKDAAKADEGIGDLLIWKTILDLGATRCQSVVFVSGEEKADWVHRSDGQALFPRYELIDEYRRVSKGKSFHLVSLARLLELLGASKDAVQEVSEVRTEELITLQENVQVAVQRPFSRGRDVERVIFNWVRQIHPGKPIRLGDRHIDIVVQDDSGPVGYQIKQSAKYLGAISQIRNWMGSAETLLYLNSDLAKLYFVIVERVREDADEIADLFSEHTFVDPKVGTIVGFINEGSEFEEVFRLAAVDSSDIPF